MPGAGAEEQAPSRRKICIRRTELIVNGILFGIWNNVSTIINAQTLVEVGHTWGAALTLFFLFFPGIVTSLGFLILHWLGHRRFKKVPPANLMIYFFVLLLCYPIVPIGLCIYTLIKGGKHREMAILSKLFEGFLDDGPQFVLRLVIVVLFGVGTGKDRDDVIFTLSMITSFGALVYFGLKFNERQTNGWTKWFISFPMFAASVASRAFTLAVFLKETTLGRHLEATNTSDGTNKEWVGGLIVIVVYVVINIGIFRLCGQDMIRSIVFGISSTLIPAGYNNDTYFYQRPQQPMWGASSDAYADGEGGLGESGGQIGPEERGVFEGEAKPSISDEKIPKMRSALFLILHNVSSTVFLSSCAVYILLSRSGKLSESSGHALILPQILAVVPGCFFTLARSILLVEKPPCGLDNWSCFERSESLWKGFKTGLAVIFGIIAYSSLIPAALASVVWKVASLTVNLIDGKD